MEERSITDLIPWILAVMLTWFFIENGWPKLFPSQTLVSQFEGWGYDRNLARIIGILEVTGAILVLIPRLSFYGAVLLMGIMVGAIYTHLSTGIGSPTFAIFLFVAAAVLAWFRRRRAYGIGTKGAGSSI